MALLQPAGKKGKMPSSKGARDFASREKQPVARPKSRTAKAAQDAISADLLDACVRCLGQIDMLVGKARVKAAVHLDPKDDLTKKARGTVFVVGAPDPEAVLRAVAKVRRAGAIDEAIVILPRDIDQAWFAALSAGPWSCCVPREAGSPIVAHIGGHARGFSLVFAQLGVVMTVEQSVAGDRRE